MIDAITLNRIIIKDIFAAIRKDLKLETGLQLIFVELVDKREQRLLKHATGNDIEEARDFFIKNKLKIKYFPSSNKKSIKGKIVSIDQIYE